MSMRSVLLLVLGCCALVVTDAWGQGGAQPSPGGIGYATAAQLAAVTSCAAPGRQITIATDVADATLALNRCALDGGRFERLVAPLSPQAVPGITTDASTGTVTSFRPSVSPTALNIVLGTNMEVPITVGTLGKVATLPPHSACRSYHVYIEDTGTGPLTLLVDGSDLINGLATIAPVTGRWAGYKCTCGNTGWYCETAVSVPMLGYAHFPPSAAKLPATTPAILSNAENNARLTYENVTSTCASWSWILPGDYNSGLVMTLLYSMASATSGGVAFGVDVMAMTPGEAVDVNTDSFDTVNTCVDAAVPAVAGYMEGVNCPLVTTDSVAAWELARFRVCRATTHATDTAAGLLELYGIALQYTKVSQ